MTTVTAEVADCVRSHISWMTAQSQLSPHPSWDDGPFDAASPTSRVSSRCVRRAFAAVAAGLAARVHRGDGGRRGPRRVESTRVRSERRHSWQPGWMVAPTTAFDAGPVLLSRRAGLSVGARRHEAHLQPLLDRDDTWRAEARAGSRYAGRAWLHVTDDIAGLYDMAHAASPTSRVSSP